jgi:hypothetical protein
MATANHTDKAPRRIAVILGAGRSGRRLLDLVLPLVARDRDVEMQGVFLEEAELQHAAELPFVKELCRVTFSVREFTSDQFERALALRMRSAQRALELLARRIGVQHSFRNVRGPALRLLIETASVSDVTVFEPARMLAPPAPSPARIRPRPRRVVAAVGEPAAGRKALLAAMHLADGDASRLSVLAAPELAQDPAVMETLFRSVAREQPLRVRLVPAEAGIRGLVDAAHAEGAALFVVAATDDLLQAPNLQVLRERLRCPICLVRRWGETTAASTR